MLSVLALLSSHVWANPKEAQVERAQDLVLKARQSASKGEYKESIRLFEEANDVISTPDNIFAIASIYERIEGSCQQAVSSWQRFLRACQGCSLLERGRRRAEILNAQCRVKLTIDSKPVGAKVTFDGELKGNTPLNVQTFAGQHRFSLELKGYHPIQHSIFLLKGSKTEVKSVSLTPLTSAALAPEANASPTPHILAKDTTPTVPSTSTARHDTKSQSNLASWVLIGTGVALTGLGVWSYLSARAEVDDINNASSLQSLNTAQQDSSYQLREGFGYVGMTVGLGLSTYGLVRFSF